MLLGCIRNGVCALDTGELPEEEILEDADIAARLIKEPPKPPLDLAQVRDLEGSLLWGADSLQCNWQFGMYVQGANHTPARINSANSRARGPA